MKRATGDQGSLFGPAEPPRRARPRQPPKQTTVVVDREAIAAAAAGQIDGERMITEAVRAARPDVYDSHLDCRRTGSGGFLMGFTSEAEAKAAADEYLRYLAAVRPLTDGFTLG